MAAVSSKSYQFRMARQDKWLQLEELVGKAEKGGIQSLTAAQVFELPHLYKAALSSLSVARAISLDRNVVDYLESLTARAYFLLYGHQRPVWEAFRRLMVFLLPNAVRSVRQELMVSVLVFFLGVIAAYVLVQKNPDWYFTFVDQSMAAGRQPGASADQLRATLYPKEGGTSSLDIFATSLFTHNARVGLMAFALGFALGVPTLWLLFGNGATLGAFLALFHSQGLLYELGGWLIIHGSTEILAILLCGAAGLAIARHYIFPGRLGRMESLALFGRQAALVAFGCITMFLVAGLLEGFARQLVTSDVVRYGVGLTFLALWGLYYLAGGRGQEEAVL
ncbi:stage II sporulation protein M [Kordiimonas marina]|uniref:stage II sporulation protein M n=1 Tax=Kordiimonas marina TaxID=2872312 RepID=UPI001FF2ED52|nr:stage II sporulation protein M [Kordiimonas marina]MCJ9427539.1 stage II sporulation protein M [Kordiimonas marina]